MFLLVYFSVYYACSRNSRRHIINIILVFSIYHLVYRYLYMFVIWPVRISSEIETDRNIILYDVHNNNIILVFRRVLRNDCVAQKLLFRTYIERRAQCFFFSPYVKYESEFTRVQGIYVSAARQATLALILHTTFSCNLRALANVHVV